MENRIADHFQVVSQIHSNEMDTLYSVFEPSKEQHLKTLHLIHSMSPMALQAAGAPINKLKNLCHPNLIHIEEWEITDKKTPCYLMEALPLEQIAVKTPPLPSSTTLDLLFQLCRALSYLHQSGMVHGNLKPTMLIWDNDEVRIFGYATILNFQNHEIISQYLSQKYTAPETFKENAPNHLSDLFSLRAIKFSLFAGAPPTSDPDKYHENEIMLTETLGAQYEIPAGVSGEKGVTYRSIREILRQLIPLLEKAHSGRLSLKNNFTLSATDHSKESNIEFLSRISGETIHHLKLQPLSKEKTGELIKRLLYLEKIPSSLLNALYTITHGNLLSIINDIMDFSTGMNDYIPKLIEPHLLEEILIK